MDDRRGAQRIAVPKPVSATFGGFDAKILEISLIGCSIEHVDRIAAKARLPLKFKWRAKEVRIEATVIRSEMRSVGGKPAYVSGLELCRTPEESPSVVREIVEYLAKATGKTAPAAAAPPPPSPPPAQAAPALPPPPAPEIPLFIAVEEDAEVLSADYLQCTFAGGKWTRLYAGEPTQPPDGFTIPAPSNDSEVDVLCRAYEKADAAKRRAMRARFELAIKQQRRA